MTSLADSPMCVLVAVCNEVIEDSATHNKTLVSLFNQIGCKSFPAFHPRMAIAASLTNLRIKTKITFRISSPSNVQIFNWETEASGADPLAMVDIVVNLFGLPLPEEGVYFVDVIADGSPVGSRRFSAKKI